MRCTLISFRFGFNSVGNTCSLLHGVDVVVVVLIDFERLFACWWFGDCGCGLGYLLVSVMVGVYVCVSIVCLFGVRVIVVSLGLVLLCRVWLF